MTDKYRQLLIESIDHLLTVRDEMFTNAINLAMANELEEFDEAFDEGDLFQFELEHIEDAKDINLQKLVTQIKSMQDIIDELININAITDEELDVDDDDDDDISLN